MTGLTDLKQPRVFLKFWIVKLHLLHQLTFPTNPKESEIIIDVISNDILAAAHFREFREEGTGC